MSQEETRFMQAAARLLDRNEVGRSTMMGWPCLRVNTRFFATFDRASGDLVVKLPAARVDQLIAGQRGAAFAPAGRRFREWVAIPVEDEAEWPAYLDEAIAFVAGASETG